MYQALYELISNGIFDSTSLSGYQDLVTTLLATIGSVFIVSIPFLVVWKVIKLIVG